MENIKNGITRESAERALKYSKSARGAARYLSIAYETWRTWGSMYIDEKTGKTLFELSKNTEKGLGVKRKKFRKRVNHFEDIIIGTVKVTNQDSSDIKSRIFFEGIIEEKCSMCGFADKSLVGGHVPLIASHKDGDKRNWEISNLEFLCFNCYYIHIGDIFTKKEMTTLEVEKENISDKTLKRFDLSDNYIQELAKLVKNEISKVDMSGESLITRK